MDWPDADGDGAHFDKRLLDDYMHVGWGELVEGYGWAAAGWLSEVVYSYDVRKGGGA